MDRRPAGLQPERVEAEEERDPRLVPHPLPSLVAAAELREAMKEYDQAKARLLSGAVEPDELRAAAKQCASGMERVVAALALVQAEGGVLKLQIRDDRRQRFV